MGDDACLVWFRLSLLCIGHFEMLRWDDNIQISFLRYHVFRIHTSLFGSSYTPILDNFLLPISHALQISSPYPPPSKPNLTINDQSHFFHLNQPNGGSRTSSYVPVSLTFISLTILPWRSRFIDIRCLFIIAVVWNLDGCYSWSRKWSDIVITLWSPQPIQMLLSFSSASYYLAPNGFDISHANLLNISSHCRGYILFNSIE